MILFINSADFEKLHFALISDKTVRQKKIRIRHPELEQTAAKLAEFLRRNKANLAEMKKIIVVAGSGSFTGIRVGAALALAFNFALGVPAFAVKKQKLPEDLRQLGRMRLKKMGSNFDPEYGAKPNVTIPASSGK